MRSHSFFTKLLAGNLLIIALLVCVAGVFAYRQLDAIHQAESESHQRRILDLARRYVEQVWAARGADLDSIDRRCKELPAGAAMRLTVIAEDGRVLGDSEADPRRMGNHRTTDRPEVLEALQGRPGQATRSSGTLGVEFRYLALPIRREGQVVAAVRLATPVLAIAQSGDFIRTALLWSGLAAVAAAALLALLLSWLWYAPLRQITRTARTIAGGDLSPRAAIAGSGELAQLATALNDMRDSIRRQIGQIAAQRMNLVTIVESLREGVLAMDAEGKIALINASAREQLAEESAEGDEPLEGRHLQSVVRIPEIVDVYLEAVRGGQPVSRQIDADIRGKRQVFEVHVTRLAEGAVAGLDVLMVIRDITHLVRMAAVKAEFVANASHELRTPLATLRAAVDSLACLTPADTEEFRRIAGILDRHTARLEEMTNDLLSLHMVESARHRPRIEPVDLGQLAAWAREVFVPRAQQKGVALEVVGGEAPAGLRSDPALLRLILQNLLDNAVKFTPPGGKVSCDFAPPPGGRGVTLTVRDSGCGIPPELQDRVFERFFQADPARSGEPRIRGTGLGLAIVKHAAERLGATVKLHSAVGQGTTITVTVPAAGGE